MKNKLLFLFLTVSVFSFAQNCSELFISEYVEGWANNKAIERYNPTDTAINLSDYFISRFANGSTQTTVANAVQLSGIVQAHDVYVAVLDKRNPLGTGQ
jgi:predicted extracellular nuclease